MDKRLQGITVLVAGGTGTLGIPLVHRLLALGATVRVVALTPLEQAQRLLPAAVEYQQADLTDYQACLQVTLNQHWVFNLLGIKGSVGIGESKVASYFVAMLRFQTNLMEAAYQNKVEKFLFVSSVNAYPPADVLYEEHLWSGLPKQNDRYPGLAKRIGEIQGETYLQQANWQAVKIVRLANVYGPYDDFNPATAQVIPALIARMCSGEDPITVWGDGQVVRDFIFSNDAAYWLLEAIERLPACVPVNLSNGIPYTIKQVATCIAEQLPHKPTLAWDPSQPTGDRQRLFSIERAESLLGFRCQTSLADGIQQTIQWYLANQQQATQQRELLYEAIGSNT